MNDLKKLRAQPFRLKRAPRIACFAPPFVVVSYGQGLLNDAFSCTGTQNARIAAQQASKHVAAPPTMFGYRSHAQLCFESFQAINELMHSIDNDARHTDLTIVDERPVSRRSMPTWMMAYVGNSLYVARHVEALLGKRAPRTCDRVNRPRSLIVGFGTADAVIGS